MADAGLVASIARISLFGCLMLPLAAPAQQALVTTQDVAALEIGQAFLAHFGPKCYAIMPTHVLREAERPALLREGAPPLLGETHDAADLGGDIGIALVNGGITTSCGLGVLTIQRSIERLLQQGRLATLRAINGDGTVAQLSVTIVDNDGHEVLRVQPTNQNNPIHKGLSGSLLMIDGVTVGMLLSVNALSGIGAVTRIDRLMEKVDAHLMDHSKSDAESIALARSVPGETAKSRLRPRVVAWNTLPLDENRRALNLTAGDDTPPWASQPPRWPVSLDLQAGEGVVVVSAVLLDGRGVIDAGQLPAQVEIFTNLSGEPRGWHSVTSEEIDFRDGVAHIQFAPLRTRLVRLNFSRTIGGGKVISLRRVELRDE